MLNIQENILSADISATEKQYPLLSVSVAINSVDYWLKQINDPHSLWTPFVGEPKAFKWPWKKDAEGAVGGAIGGAIGGIGGGIGGVLIGGLLGGIGGAIAESVVAAIFRD